MRVTWNSAWMRRVCCSCRKNLALFDETEANAVSRTLRISLLGILTETYSKGRFFLTI
jgi:hypothetical protein